MKLLPERSPAAVRGPNRRQSHVAHPIGDRFNGKTPKDEGGTAGWEVTVSTACLVPT